MLNDISSRLATPRLCDCPPPLCATQAAQVWGEEEKVTLRRRELQVQEAEERADNLLQSAAAEVDRQSQALEEERRVLQQHQHAFQQVGFETLAATHLPLVFAPFAVSLAL